MIPALPDAHARALVDAVTVAVAGVPVHLDEVPDDPVYPYVVVESGSPLSSAQSLGDINELGVLHPSLLVAGIDAEEVRMVRDRLERLYDGPVRVDGRLIDVEKLVAGNLSRDADLDRPVRWCRDQLEVRSYAS